MKRARFSDEQIVRILQEEDLPCEDGKCLGY
jgi:hypothetical protein